MRRLALSVALSSALLLGGCARGELHVLAYSERLDLAERESFAVLGTQLGHERCWGFGEPAAVISVLAPRYRPPETPPEVGTPAEAPGALGGLLAAAREELEARGYRLVEVGETPGVVALIAHSTVGERTSRVGLHLGGAVGEVYRPDWISLANEVDPQDEADPEELLRELFAIVPTRGSGEPD